MDAGNKRIGFIGGFGNIMGDHEYPEDPRAFAFRNWTVRLGLDVDGLVFDEGPFTVENGRALGERFVAECGDRLPDALIVAADPIAVGVLQAFAAAGILVPRDMRLVSINNQEIANYTSPTLSSYDINKDELAKRGIHAVGGHFHGALRQPAYEDFNQAGRPGQFHPESQVGFKKKGFGPR